MLDAVVRFNPSFAWTALSGFQSTGIPLFAQVALVGFSTCRVYSSFLLLSLTFARTFLFFLVRRDAHFLPGLFILVFCPAGFFHEVFSNCVRIHREWKIVVVRGHKQQGSVRGKPS